MPCVPGARVKSVAGPQAVKAEIAIRMGAMGMTFTGPVTLDASDAASPTVTIKANTRETRGQSYATGDITPDRRDGEAAEAVEGAAASADEDPARIFRSLTGRFGGRLDVKLTSGLDAAERTAHTMEALACAQD